MASVKPKKHLGQHFLKDENIAFKIANALDTNGENVIEIGPGTGVLTKYLLEIEFESFFAFDVDEESIKFLKETYPTKKNQFVLQDFLKYQLPKEENFSIIGNFPYNISSQLFFSFWENRSQVLEVVCMIQKEVADRICSKHGSKTYGILSVLMQAFYTTEYLFKVPPGVFHPPPKVESAVIRLKRNDIESLNCDEALFKRVVKAGFGKRRKTLRNALKEINLPDSVKPLEILGKRAEQLTVDEFVFLTSKISS